MNPFHFISWFSQAFVKVTESWLAWGWGIQWALWIVTVQGKARREHSVPGTDRNVLCFVDKNQQRQKRKKKGREGGKKVERKEGNDCNCSTVPQGSTWTRGYLWTCVHIHVHTQTHTQTHAHMGPTKNQVQAAKLLLFDVSVFVKY